MNPESWGFIGTLVGAVVGASTSIITTRLNSKNAIIIQNEVDKNLRNERFREFQRGNYLQLQEKLAISTRLIVKCFDEEEKHFRKSKEWRTNLIDRELDEQISESLRQLLLLTVRIENNELRYKLEQIRIKMVECVLSETYEVSKRIRNEISKEYVILMNAIGEELRKNY